MNFLIEMLALNWMHAPVTILMVACGLIIGHLLHAEKITTQIISVGIMTIVGYISYVQYAETLAYLGFAGVSEYVTILNSLAVIMLGYVIGVILKKIITLQNQPVINYS